MLRQLSLWRCSDHHQTHGLMHLLDPSQYNHKLTKSNGMHVQCKIFIMIELATVFFSFEIPRFSCLVSGNPFCQQSKVMSSSIIHPEVLRFSSQLNSQWHLQLTFRLFNTLFTILKGFLSERIKNCITFHG